jgi:hypothetical protein
VLAAEIVPRYKQREHEEVVSHFLQKAFVRRVARDTPDPRSSIPRKNYSHRDNY